MWVELEIEETSIFEKLLFYAKQLNQQKEPTKTTTILVDKPPPSPSIPLVYDKCFASFWPIFMQIPAQSHFILRRHSVSSCCPLKMLIFKIFLPKNRQKFLRECERDSTTITFCLLINKWISQKTLTAEIDKQKQQKINKKRLLRKSSEDKFKFSNGRRRRNKAANWFDCILA